MPTPLRRLPLLAIALCLALAALPVAGGGAAPVAKKHHRAKCKKGFVRNKRGRCVKKHKQAPPRIPVTTTVLPGSQVSIDFGGGVVRTIPLTGTVKGYVPGLIHVNTDTTVVLTKARITPAPTDIFTDSCSSPALVRSDPASTIGIDPSKTSTATLHSSGAVTATTNVLIRLVLDERQACGQPAFTTGYTDNAATVPLSGHVQPATGLANLELDSPPYPLTLTGCTTAGAPATPCAGSPTTYNTTATVKLFVKLSIGA
ncbi:MAG TPA: hypothetical protein VFT42_10065 [Solirubrobacteraceae bacterium]|nr:hypothetical protein [Solirubrobacteraceae bacterium]